jgi:hypothetical protein
MSEQWIKCVDDRSSVHLTTLSTIPQHKSQCLILLTVFEQNARHVALSTDTSQHLQHLGFAGATLPPSILIRFHELKIMKETQKMVWLETRGGISLCHLLIPWPHLCRGNVKDRLCCASASCRGLPQTSLNRKPYQIYCLEFSCIAWIRTQRVTSSTQGSC